MWDKLLGVAFALLACGGAALGVLLSVAQPPLVAGGGP